MAINFPDSPNNGDSFTSNNKTWVFDGTVWNITSGTNSVADGAITAAKLASNAVHQTKLASNLSGITITTTANRSTDIASPFTGQTIFLSDVTRLQVWNGSAWTFITNGAPGAPTSLSATALSTTSVSVAFTTGTINGAAVTNYKYAYSSNAGSTYSEFAALDPADIASPVVISGLVGATTYLIKLRAVSDFGDSVDSSAVSVTTQINVEYLIIAGGGGGGNDHGGGGGAGGYRSSVSGETTGGGGAVETPISTTLGVNYVVTVGAGGAGGLAVRDATAQGTSGANSVFSTITSTGGGYGAGQSYNGNGNGGGAGGSGGGAAGFISGSLYLTFGARTASPVQGNDGARGTNNANDAFPDYQGGGGGGAGSAGITSAQSGSPRPSGGVGLSSSISGVSTFYAGGGGGANSSNSATDNGYGGNGGGGAGSTNSLTGRPGTANTGGGGGAQCRYTSDGGGGLSGTAGSGGSGIVILRYPSAYTITLGAGLTGSTATVSSNKVTTITAGSGNVSWA